MFGKKEKQPTYITLEQFSDADLRAISRLTHGIPIIDPDLTKEKNNIQGISYTNGAVIFDRNNHLVEIREAGGSRAFPTEKAVAYQAKDAIVFLFEAPLGASDGHEDRIVTTKVSISPQGNIRQEHLFPTETAAYVGKKYPSDPLF